MRDDLMPIGEFSRRCRLPVSTLRYYHQQGLFTPARVDPATGYRYYRRDQLAVAVVVGELRSLGVTPTVIGRITSGTLSLDEAVREERERLRTEADERVRAIVALDALLARPAPAPPITIGRRAAHPVAVMRGEMRSEAARTDVVRLIVRLRARRRASGLGAPTHFGAWFPLDLDADPVPITVFTPAAEASADAALVLPAAETAGVEHVGDTALAGAYGALLDWCDAAGREPEGPVVEEYLGSRSAPRTRVSVGLRP